MAITWRSIQFIIHLKYDIILRIGVIKMEHFFAISFGWAPCQKQQQQQWRRKNNKNRLIWWTATADWLNFHKWVTTIFHRKSIWHFFSHTCAHKLIFSAGVNVLKKIQRVKNYNHIYNRTCYQYQHSPHCLNNKVIIVIC